MAGTALNHDITKIQAGQRGQLWADVAMPSAGGSITLFTDGTPDATANPNAKHLGMTEKGATLTYKQSFEEMFCDEFNNPIAAIVSGTEMMLDASLIQIHDIDLLEKLTPGGGTKSNGTGYERVTFGQRNISYSSIALIFPQLTDPTKFAVFHIFKTINKAGVAFAQAKKDKGSIIPVQFKGYDVITRAASDSVGQYWRQSLV